MADVAVALDKQALVDQGAENAFADLEAAAAARLAELEPEVFSDQQAALDYIQGNQLLADWISGGGVSLTVGGTRHAGAPLDPGRYGTWVTVDCLPGIPAGEKAAVIADLNVLLNKASDIALNPNEKTLSVFERVISNENLKLDSTRVLEEYSRILLAQRQMKLNSPFGQVLFGQIQESTISEFRILTSKFGTIKLNPIQQQSKTRAVNYEGEIADKLTPVQRNDIESNDQFPMNLI